MDTFLIQNRLLQSDNIMLETETKNIEMVKLEKLCSKIGFDLHLKKGIQILRKFLLFCFPIGMKPLITPCQFKTWSLKKLIPILEKIEKHNSDIFNAQKFQEFLKQANI
jgi:hypothetical protein